MSALANALPGTPASAWVELPADVSSDGLVGREVVVERLGPIIMASYVIANGTAREHPMSGRSRRDDETLRDVVTEGSDVLVFVSAVDETDRRCRWMQIRIFEIAERCDWGELRIGADESALRATSSTAGSYELDKSAGPVNWLRQHFLFPDRPGRLGPSGPTSGSGSLRAVRMIAVVPPSQKLASPAPCKLIGDGVIASLTEENGQWRLRRVHRQGRSGSSYDRVALIHARADIVNMTVKAGLRRLMQEELARLGSDEGEQTFTATWRRYHELENRYALRRLRDLGFLEYTSWSYRQDDENVVQFSIAPGRDGLLTRLRAETLTGGEMELECAVRLPEVLGGSARLEPASGLLQLDLDVVNPAGQVIYADTDARRVDLRMFRRNADDEPVSPPRQGFLHASIRGERRRLERRDRAMRRLMNGRIPLPQLLPLLQGIPARGKEPRPVAALSIAASACFASGRPNPEQELALNVALNTPDIAVIQGPPGTGKTQLIAALQVRLAEEMRGHAVVSRSMLLTSYQHAAVDNLVERSTVWDLPAVKIDSQNRGGSAHIENWRLATVRAVREALEGDSEGRRTIAMRDVARFAVEYCQAPVTAPELARRLNRICGQIAGLVSDQLLSRLGRLADNLSASSRVSDARIAPRRESTLRAVRGIRCEPLSFEDDGPQMAAVALAHLANVSAAGPSPLDVVRRAADWVGREPPPFLAELSAARDELLDGLIDRADQLFRPAVREEVVDLLDAIVADLDQRRRMTAEGVHEALADYLDELEGDPEAVLATLRLYTTSLAATCQQADSRAVQHAKDGERQFDTVIVDEAARANPLDLLIPLTLASRRVILVGDQNQLPHMLEPDVEGELRSNSDDELTILRESLFGRLFALLQHGDTAPGRRRAVRLRRQYRMHPVLGAFVADSFYQGDLESPRPATDFAHRLADYQDRPAAWFSVPNAFGGEHAGHSKSRSCEAQIIASELGRHVRARPDLTFGVISFYAAQVELIWKHLVEDDLARRTRDGYTPADDLLRDSDGKERTRLQVGTVDAFQGKQFDVVLLSITRSRRLPALDPAQADPAHPGHAGYERWARRTYGHLMLANRLCVAMSRQERLLVVVGDDAMFTSPLAPPGVAPLSRFYRLCAPPSPSGLVLSPARGGGR